MATSLQKTVCSYKSHIEQITKLRDETTRCLDEIQATIQQDHKEGLAALKILKLPESQLNNRPCVLFIGSQNCGKSTLLNVFLGKTHLLPIDETPCTSRIVRIVYSPKNHTKIQNPTTKKEERKTFKKNKVPEELIVLKGDDRNDLEQLKVIVEVGLNHPLLECGIELIDSPGRNENDALDQVVEEFIKKGIVPLIIYIVDGNFHVRDKDRTTIRELQDKFPNVTLMFVCTKVDVEENAYKYDREEEGDCQDGQHDCQQKMFDLAQQKKIAVFNELKRLSFLSPDDQVGNSELFHGVSATLVKQARREKLKNEATMSFEHFETCLLEKLEASLRKQSNRELAILLSAQEMFLATAVDAQVNMDHSCTKMKDDIPRFKDAEEAIFNMIGQLINRYSSIVNAVGHDLEKLSAILLKEAEEFQYTTKGANDSALVEMFSCEIKGSILDRSFNVLQRSFRLALHSIVQDTLAITELKSRVLDPLLCRLLLRVLLGNEDTALPNKDDRKAFAATNFLALEDVISSVSQEVDSLLRHHLNNKIDNVDIAKVTTSRPRPKDQRWRREVVQNILSKIDIKQLTDEVIRSSQKALVRKRQKLKDKIITIELLSSLSNNTKVAKYLPQIAQLAVSGHSLRYVIERGVPELGEQLQSTTHGQLYWCSSPSWVRESDGSMVKVVNKNVVRETFWGQTMRDCMHFKDIKERLMNQHPNLLDLRGWYMPDPDTLYLVMEAAECDLLTALKQGLSWTRRKQVAVDVAMGLEAIHGVQYVYQDLKPQNVMLTQDGTAKINSCKTENPFEPTQLGLPFHISPKMHEKRHLAYSLFSYDIYAFGSLLWVLCEGTGTRGPQAYAHCRDITAIEFAVRDHGIKPERPDQTPDAWWDLMGKCWSDDSLDIKAILKVLENIDIP